MNEWMTEWMNILIRVEREYMCYFWTLSALIGSILNPLAGKFPKDPRKKYKGAKTGTAHDWRSFYLSQYDWLKGSHMTKVVWLPKETDYWYCEFVAPNTSYATFSFKKLKVAVSWKWLQVLLAQFWLLEVEREYTCICSLWTLFALINLHVIN